MKTAEHAMMPTIVFDIRFPNRPLMTKPAAGNSGINQIRFRKSINAFQKQLFPSSQRRGGAPKGEPDKAKPQNKAAGAVRSAETFRRPDHPVCAVSPLAVGASTPPLRGGECAHSSNSLPTTSS